MNLFCLTSFPYSHCIELFGVINLLVQTGTYNATIYTPQRCDPPVRRAVAAAPNASTYTVHIMNSGGASGDKYDRDAQSALDFIGSFTTSFDDDSRIFETLVSEQDNIFRSQYLSVAEEEHQRRPFNVALCDFFAPTCYEFADRHGIPVVTVGVQNHPEKKVLEHNGMWLPYCRKPNECSVWTRLHTFWEIYVQTANFLTTVQAAEKLIRRRSADAPRARSFYPMLDMRVEGTLAPVAYQRPDFRVVGPAWLALQQQQLLADELNGLLGWLDAAAEKSIPVVYVSFGTLARLNRFETEFVLRALVNKNWRAVWKSNTEFGNELLKETGVESEQEKQWKFLAKNNVRAVEWAPQYAVLKHRAIRAFVTHGGLSSLMEAASCALPLVCVPLFGDQPYHCAQVEAIGLGIRLDKRRMTSSRLSSAIETVLHRTSFRNVAKRVSAYHATINTSARIVEFINHLTTFGYDYITPADDSFNFLTYWNADLWVYVVFFILALGVINAWVISQFLQK